MKKYSVYLWALVTLAFMGFIGIMSYWYPVTLDEYFRWGVPFRWEMIKDAYFEIVPRISMFFTIPVFALGKWFFILLNCLIQLANSLCIFYILFVRLPDIKDLRDMPYLLIILFMSIFFVCSPSQVMFWISGAANYTWTILFFLLMLCFLRQVQTNKVVFRDNLLLRIFIFILGFIVGMSNECLAPVAFGLTICFALFYEYKKIKTSHSISFLIFGLAIGCLVFFSAPAHYNKMSTGGMDILSSISLTQKLFFHIYHLNDFFISQFYLFILTVLFLLVAYLDYSKKDVQKEDLNNSLYCLVSCFIMAFILFIVPVHLLRAYYPASMLCLISFLFLVKYYIYAYKFDFSKWLCYVIITISLFLSPKFILSHYSLYIQTGFHEYFRSFSKPIRVPYMVLKGPTDNLSIGFMDPERREKVGENLYGTETSPLTNW